MTQYLQEGKEMLPEGKEICLPELQSLQPPLTEQEIALNEAVQTWVRDVHRACWHLIAGAITSHYAACSELPQGD
jgi:hypothetical protein